MSNLCWRGEYR